MSHPKLALETVQNIRRKACASGMTHPHTTRQHYISPHGPDAKRQERFLQGSALRGGTLHLLGGAAKKAHSLHIILEHHVVLEYGCVLASAQSLPPASLDDRAARRAALE